MPKPASAVPAPPDRRLELQARRNQYEVLLAALERSHPAAFGTGGIHGPVGEEARRQWEHVRRQLEAIEADLLRHES